MTYKHLEVALMLAKIQHSTAHSKSFLSHHLNIGRQKGGKEIIIEAPEWCTVTVYKLVNGQPVPFTSDPIYFEEYVQIVKGNNAKSGQPNEMWRTNFDHKCKMRYERLS